MVLYKGMIKIYLTIPLLLKTHTEVCQYNYKGNLDLYTNLLHSRQGRLLL